MKKTTQYFCFLLATTLAVAPFAKAQTGCPTGGCVPTPPQPPSVSTGGAYCTEIYNELTGVLSDFNNQISLPPTWVPVSLGPTIFPANLQVSDANTGPAVGGEGYINSVLPQLYESQAMGAKAILLQIGFPVLYSPFLTYEKLTPADYTGFYGQLAQTIHSLGMKVIVENSILLTDDIQAGWGPTLAEYFATLSWDDYIQARASMAATLVNTMQPDYLVLATEPDTEATQAGQPNLLIPTDAAAMVQAEITAVRSSDYPDTKIGAGFGAWPQVGNADAVAQFTAAYVALPMDFLDAHVYPLNQSGPAGTTISVIDNVLTMAAGAAVVGMPISMSEFWAWKMENAELNVIPADTIRGRNPFSFWAPIDQTMMQTMQALANYTDFVFMANDGPDMLFTYTTFGGTADNGGLANCTCATGNAPGSVTYCDSYDTTQTQTQQAKVANESAQYSVTGFTFYNDMVTGTVTAPPQPTGLSVNPSYTQTSLSWNLDTANPGVAGYNVYRCQPATEGGPCTGNYVGLTTVPSYTDVGLVQNTPYNYQIQAFDMANNTSALSAVVSTQTARNSTSSPTNLVATVVSAQEISLTWAAPAGGGVSDYLVFTGNSQSSLLQVATVTPSKTCPGLPSPCYNATLLSPGTVYYFGVEAKAAGVTSAMSNLANATTYGLPNPPSNVTASVVSPTEINLSWDEYQGNNSLPVSGYTYEVWRGTVSGNVAKLPGTVTGTTYSNKELTPNTTYYYEIVAVDTGKDDSSGSDQISAITDSLPPPPVITSISAPSATEVALTWTWSALPNGLPAARFEIDCGTSQTNLSQVGTEQASKGDSFTWRNAAEPGTKYYCDVIAVDTATPADDGPPSAIMSVTTPPMPNAPTGVTATADSSTKVVVKWSETLPPNGLSISNYTVYRGMSAGSLTELGTAKSTSYNDTSVTAGQTYYYAVTATDSGRDVSAQSSPPAEVTTPSN